MSDGASGTDEERSFGIGAVARMTGLTDHTIRVWERRYQAVVANRAANGRRVYLPADIEKLRLLKLLTDNGISIGRIAAEPLDALIARVEEMRELASPLEPARKVSLAVLGELLPTLLRAAGDRVSALTLLAAGSQEAQLSADLAGRSPEVLVVELPVIAADTEQSLLRLKREIGASGIVCVYGCSRERDAERLRANGVQLLRAPVTVEEAEEAVVRASRPGRSRPTTGLGNDHKPDLASLTGSEEPVEPRLFTPQQLSALARQSSAIECECPQHLADLVAALSSFEIYSANCESVSDADEALHRYLHRTTASARAMLERALERVAREENLI